MTTNIPLQTQLLLGKDRMHGRTKMDSLLEGEILYFQLHTQFPRVPGVHPVK